MLSPALTNTEDEEVMVSPHENNMMEIIQEVDSSIELNSSKLRSKRNSNKIEEQLYQQRARMPPIDESSYEDQFNGPAEFSAI